jgi:hypothetical protein
VDALYDATSPRFQNDFTGLDYGPHRFQSFVVDEDGDMANTEKREVEIVRPEGNVLAMHFDGEITGASETVIDSSPRGNDGTSFGSLSCGSSVPGKYGNACQFDGSSSYIERIDSLLSANFPGKIGGTENSFTVSLWMRQDTDKDPQFMFAKHNGVDADSSFSSWLELSTQIFKFIGTGGVGGAQAGGTNPSDGQYHHILYTYDSAIFQVKTYVDNIASGSNTGTQLLNQGPAPFLIGSEQSLSSAEIFEGAIDEVNIWDYVLDSTERTNVFNGVPLTETCSDTHWNQDEVCKDVGGVCGGFESGTELTCDDGIDNDCDGDVDTADVADCPVKFGRPSSLIAAGTDLWKDEVGGSTNIYNSIDEVSSSDADYIVSQTNPGGSDIIFGLNQVTDPQSSSGHVIRFRYSKDASAGKQIDMTLQIGDSTTADCLSPGPTFTDVSSTWTEYSYTLSASEADCITDYSTLQVKVSATGVGGGQARAGRTSWLEFEVP